MCGIAGILKLDGAPPRLDELRRMCGVMMHRGPDTEGFYVCPDVGLGMRRLSHTMSIAFTLCAIVIAALAAFGAAPFWVFTPLLALTFSMFGLISSNFNALAMEPVGRVAGSASALYGAVTASGGALLLSVHTHADGFPPGSVRRLEEWWGHRVGLDGHFIAAEEVIAGLERAGFDIVARLERGPSTLREFPSQRTYLLARRL